MSTSDDSLIVRAIGGDGDALGELLEGHAGELRDRLRGQIPARWQSLLSVDDVLQETYTDAFLDIASFEPRGNGSFLAWLVKLAERNLADTLRALTARKRGGRWHRVNLARQPESLQEFYERLAYSGSTPSGHAAGQEVLTRMREAINQLPQPHHTAVEICDLQGRPVAEAAAALQRTEGAVYMLLSRAHRWIQQMMGTFSLQGSGGG